MQYSEMFEDSAEMHPDSGCRLSPAACAFLLAELEGRVINYTEYLEEQTAKGNGPSSIPYMMAERHLEGLTHITEAVRAGMERKGGT